MQVSLQSSLSHLLENDALGPASPHEWEGGVLAGLLACYLQASTGKAAGYLVGAMHDSTTLLALARLHLKP